MAKQQRFIKTYARSGVETQEIWVDTQTGVNYFFCASGAAGGLTPLLDKDGKVVVTPVETKNEKESGRRLGKYFQPLFAFLLGFRKNLEKFSKNDEKNPFQLRYISEER